MFAQLYGTVELLEPEERNRIKGLIINKFRGDKSILEPGLRQLEDLCKIPVAGVVPYMNVDIEDEDSLSSKLGNTRQKGCIDIAVIRFPKISNFTDMDVFERMDEVSIRYVSKPSELKTPDMVILPGTKIPLMIYCGCARSAWKQRSLSWQPARFLYGEFAAVSR